jgi:hypothetical protein
LYSHCLIVSIYSLSSLWLTFNLFLLLCIWWWCFDLHCLCSLEIYKCVVCLVSQ